MDHYSQISDEIRTLLGSFDFPEEDKPSHVTDFRIVGPDTYVMTLYVGDNQYILHASDFFSSLEDVENGIRSAYGDLHGSFVKLKHPRNHGDWIDEYAESLGEILLAFIFKIGSKDG